MRHYQDEYHVPRRKRNDRRYYTTEPDDTKRGHVGVIGQILITAILAPVMGIAYAVAKAAEADPLQGVPGYMDPGLIIPLVIFAACSFALLKIWRLI